MRRMLFKISAIALLMSGIVLAQSLGDVARENREKKAQDAPSALPKVITNKDIPKDPEANPDDQDADAPTRETAAAPVSDDWRGAHPSTQQRLAEQRAAGQWKRQILAQKNKMAVLQARIDQINASIQSANGSVQYEAPYNRYEVRQRRRIAQIQEQLDEQKIKLAEMQEGARRAGMHTAVYDP